MILNKDPGRRELAIFGIALPAFFALAGWAVFRKTGNLLVAQSIWAAGGLCAVLYLLLPRLRRPMFVGWSYLTFPLGWLLSHLILLIVFWLVLTPIGLIVRLTGHDSLNRRFDRSATTYWSKRESIEGVSRYFRQS